MILFCIFWNYLYILFSEAVDFQFLPLTQDTKSDKVDYVHDKIFLKKLPTFEFLL